jgi:hypothetical protein
MKYLLLLLMMWPGLAVFAQKSKKPTNYLRREKQEAETWFTFCGKKNETRIKAADLAKAESIKTNEKYFDGMDILSMEVVVKMKDAPEEKFSSGSTQLSPEIKSKLATLSKGDKVFVYVRLRNRSTQVVTVTPRHTFFVSA